MSPNNASADSARLRVEAFEREVAAEPWKKSHHEAMRCFSFEGTLKLGIAAFDFIIGLDQVFRLAILSADDADPDALNIPMVSMRMWLAPCEAAESQLKEFERAGYEVTGAEEFRKRHAEAKWMLADAKDAFGHEKFVALRDEAVDHMRSSDE